VPDERDLAARAGLDIADAAVAVDELAGVGIDLAAIDSEMLEPSAAGFRLIEVGLASVAPVNTARPAVGSDRGDACASARSPAIPASAMHVTIVVRPIARNVSPR
jgi:hypothetical protein